jgi:hypothetical protein
MIYLNLSVDNIDVVRQIYNQIRILKGDSEEGPWVALTDASDDATSKYVDLVPGQAYYRVIDELGTSTNWYRSYYVNTTSSGQSGYSEPVLGEAGDIYYDPLYPEEVAYGTEDKLIIKRIRRLIGDPVGLRREYGEDAASSIHPDGRVYELDEKGWPADVHMNNQPMNDSIDPTINGYKFLIFDEEIDTTTWSGGREYGVDIWYYTFRNSDREIMEAYDSTPPPGGLSSTSANSEAYMLACAIDILQGELWEDATEDGAKLADEGSKYDPQPGLDVREKMLDKLKKRLDDIIKRLLLSDITGVLID